jgi:hypothetical protein
MKFKRINVDEAMVRLRHDSHVPTNQLISDMHEATSS